HTGVQLMSNRSLSSCESSWMRRSFATCTVPDHSQILIWEITYCKGPTNHLNIATWIRTRLSIYCITANSQYWRENMRLPISSTCPFLYRYFGSASIIIHQMIGHTNLRIIDSNIVNRRACACRGPAYRHRRSRNAKVYRGCVRNCITQMIIGFIYPELIL